MRTVLVVAAERFELEWIRAARANVRFVKVANGPGPRLAAEAVDQVTERIDAILSTGLCGALAPELRIADVVVATAVNGRAICIPGGLGRCCQGLLVSVDRVAQTAAEKQALAESGAVAVEMEAAGVLERAAQLGVPFYCVRVVSDTADESFSFDLNAARRGDGRFDRGRIVRQALRRPFTRIPELLRLRRNSARAVRALGDFVADCDF